MTKKRVTSADEQIGELRGRLSRTVGRGGNHSPLYVWMKANHGKLTALFEELSPVWAALADELGRMGLKDGQGKQPTRHGARLTWYRVRREVEGAKLAKKVNVRPPVVSVPESEPPRRKFGLAGLRGGTPAAPPKPPPPAMEVAKRTPEEVEQIIKGLTGSRPENQFRRED